MRQDVAGDDKQDPIMDNVDSYGEYLRAWSEYLRRAEWVRYGVWREEDAFFEALEPFIRRGTTVLRWPFVWPEVEWLFETRERFVEAVRAGVEAAGRRSS